MSFFVFYNAVLQQTYRTKREAERYVRAGKQDPNADGRKFSIKEA